MIKIIRGELYEKALTKKSTVKDFSVVYSILRLMFVHFFVIWLSACSILSQQTPSERPLNTNLREQQLMAMQQFTLQASVGIKTPTDSTSANLRWQQYNNRQFQARLSNFLGISLFELSQSETGSEIQLKGETYRAVDTSSLLLQLSGWSMPLYDMPLWLRGLPGNNSTNITKDQFGRTTSFSLTDSTGIVWQLEYQSFFPDSLSLPKRLILTSSDNQIKIVIRNWQ
ncbi:lipoprotein insertase outer membrane protein LolB [Rheinheimera sp. D18]|uniref:lipoprotein insertase outer membrane protein LolB n=1 Tax=Rheinheimera sp. D18 TaxID=2545632 RepID=UPI001FB6E765|nr:lipoprotein insertase outer membrane protein LolB [Rheinheimera sp. D18]